MSDSIRYSTVRVFICVCIIAFSARGISPDLSDPNPAEQGLANGGGKSASPGFQVWSVVGPGAVAGYCDATEFHAQTGLGATLNAGFLNPLDLDFDGAANGKDVFVFPLGWMKYPGQPGYRSGGDLNGDSQIGPEDLLIYSARRQE